MLTELATLTKSGIIPHLAVIIVGADPASHVYVGAKERACARLGITSSKFELPADADWEEVTSLVQELNERDDVDGILVQSPLPEGMDELVISELINPEKDVDGFPPAQPRSSGAGPGRWPATLYSPWSDEIARISRS